MYYNGPNGFATCSDGTLLGLCGDENTIGRLLRLPYEKIWILVQIALEGKASCTYENGWMKIKKDNLIITLLKY